MLSSTETIVIRQPGHPMPEIRSRAPSLDPMSRLAVLAACWCFALYSQDIEDFKIEAGAGAWLAQATGTIQAGPVPIDLENDLGLHGRHPQLAGRLAFQPVRRHRILVEGAPYRFEAENEIAREIIYAGRVYSVRDRIASRAEVNYFFAGYQFDLLSTNHGHLGFQAGGAWFDASATLRSTTLNAEATEAHSIGLPLAGIGFRYGKLIGASGAVKGMALGDLGHYVDARAQFDVHLGRHLTLQAGYAVLDAEVRQRSGANRLMPRFQGPLFSIEVRR
jgi:hypothetical protein